MSPKKAAVGLGQAGQKRRRTIGKDNIQVNSAYKFTAHPKPILGTILILIKLAVVQKRPQSKTTVHLSNLNPKTGYLQAGYSQACSSWWGKAIVWTGV